MIVSGLLSTDVERDDFWEGDYYCLSPHELEHGGGGEVSSNRRDVQRLVFGKKKPEVGAE